MTNADVVMYFPRLGGVPTPSIPIRTPATPLAPAARSYSPARWCPFAPRSVGRREQGGMGARRLTCEWRELPRATHSPSCPLPPSYSPFRPTLTAALRTRRKGAASSCSVVIARQPHAVSRRSSYPTARDPAQAQPPAAGSPRPACPSSSHAQKVTKSPPIYSQSRPNLNNRFGHIHIPPPRIGPCALMTSMIAPDRHAFPLFRLPCQCRV